MLTTESVQRAPTPRHLDVASEQFEPEPAARLRVLAITRIFPNRAEPLSAPFNRQQFKALAERCELEVLATIPWLPGKRLVHHGDAVPRRDVIDGLRVRHPRTPYVPRLPGISGALYTAAIAPAVLRYRGRVDVVLGSWAYPDGCAAVALADLLDVPAVVKVHGSDINAIARLPGPRRVVRALLPRAHRVVAVSRALAEECAAIGVPRERIDVVYNGVDAELFHPRDRGAARHRLALPADRRIALYVGNLKVSKGVLDLVAAFQRVGARLSDALLVVVGDGPDRAQVAAAASALGAQVRLIGARPLAEVPTWLAACDALVLPSWAEGTPNCVLEALSCGRRVVATAVGGTPDLVTSPALGELVPPRNPHELAAALERALRQDYDPAEVAARGSRGSWTDSAASLHASLTRALDEVR